MDAVAGGPGSSGAEPPRACAWCGTPAVSPGATSCVSCGAALAQRESIGELAIPGLTAVDAALQDYDKRPLHLRGPSPSQGVAPALLISAVAGGPIGIAAIGGVAAVVAAEYLGARRGSGSAALEDVGRPSEVVLQALEHLGDGGDGDTGTGTPTGPELAASGANDDGRSIWSDLPPVAPAFEAMEDAEDEEGRADGR